MKSIIQKSLVIALVYYAVAIIGCVKCDCRNSEGKEYKYKDMAVQNLAYYFTAGKAFTVSNFNYDTAQSLQYGINIQLAYDVACNKWPEKNTALINTSYACDCNVGQPYSKDAVDSLFIITLNDLDDKHPAGSNANDCFRIVMQNSSGTLTHYDLNYGIESGLFPIDWNGQARKDMYFTNPEVVNQMVAFEIKIKSKTGKIYSAKTKPVFLK